MSAVAVRQSPIHELLVQAGAEWSTIGDAKFAFRIQADEAEQAALRTVGLCDLSGLPKLGLKGSGSAAWLASQGIDPPATVYGVNRVDDGLVVRLGAHEFFIEEGPQSTQLGAIVQLALGDRVAQVYPFGRQDATFVIAGPHSLGVLSQTCGIDFSQTAVERVLTTRIAAMSCTIFPTVRNDTPCYRIWIDPSQAVYLWQTLAEICTELGGGVIGARHFLSGR